MKTVTISMPEDLANKVKALAKQEHRNFSKQVAFFCDQGIRDLEGSKVESTEIEGAE